jgi:hypothetical protein
VRARFLVRAVPPVILYRHRLTRETRTLAGQIPLEVYDLQYVYDQVGNRTMKANSTTQHETYYEYDTDYEDPNDL